MRKLLEYLLAIAARQYVQKHKPYIVGITGSVGKTTCRMIVTHMLRHQFPGLVVDTSKKNFNSEIGLCFAILGINSYTPNILGTISILFQAFWIVLTRKSPAIMVLEYGIDHPNDMQQLLAIAVPHLAILTGIDAVHAAYFPDKEAIFDEKVQLLDAATEVAFWSVDLSTYMQGHTFHRDVLSFSLHEGQEADISFDRYGYRRIDEVIGSQGLLRQGDEQVDALKTNLLGEEHMGYISLAYEIACIVGQRFSLLLAEQDMKQLQFDLQAGRSTILRGKWGSLLLDSSYNASPQSMTMLIRIITQLRKELFPERQLVFCLGEMRELGQYSQEAHSDLARQILHADHIFLIGADPLLYTLPALLALGYSSHRIQHFTHATALGQALDTYLSEQQELALVLFKGSQNTIFLEEAVKQVLRYPEDVSLLCRQEARRKKLKVKS